MKKSSRDRVSAKESEDLLSEIAERAAFMAIQKIESTISSSIEEVVKINRELKQGRGICSSQAEQLMTTLTLGLVTSLGVVIEMTVDGSPKEVKEHLRARAGELIAFCIAEVIPGVLEVETLRMVELALAKNCMKAELDKADTFIVH